MLPTTSSSMPPPIVAANPPPLFPPHAFQQAAAASSSSSSSGQQQLAISNGVLLAAVIFLFMVVVFVFLLYLYAKRYLGANPLLATPSTPSSSRFLFVAASPLPTRGLPAAALRSLPVTVYSSAAAAASTSPTAGKDSKDRLECAVCLSEVADGEKVRALPKCAHAFHVECIDMWFHSHDTCPLCRAPVAAAGDHLAALPREDPSAADAGVVFPTNVLFWGTHDDVTNAGLSIPPPPPLALPFAAGTSSATASASGRQKENLVIDIPARGVAIGTAPVSSPLPASRMPGGGAADDMRSPVSARLRSLRRLLSRGKQAVVGTSSYSPRGGAGDIEQGFAGAEAGRPPKTPKTPKTPPSAN